MRKRYSKVWTISKDELQILVNTSESIYSILPKLGLSRTSSGSFKELKKRLIEEKIDLTTINKKAKEKQKNGIRKYTQGLKIPLKNILIVGSSYSRTHLKRRLVEEGLKEYKCCECGNNGSWNGKKLNLQLDHINGINDDNRIENLRIICPNCHSQTPTFCSKNIKIKNKKVKIRNSKINIEKDKLELLIKNKPMTEIGKMFGVSDNAIRKKCKKLGIEVPKIGKGYWTKIKYGS